MTHIIIYHETHTHTRHVTSSLRPVLIRVPIIRDWDALLCFFQKTVRNEFISVLNMLNFVYPLIALIPVVLVDGCDIIIAWLADIATKNKRAAKNLGTKSGAKLAPSHSLWLFWPWLNWTQKVPSAAKNGQMLETGPLWLGVEKTIPRKVRYMPCIRDRGYILAWDFANGTYWGELKVSKDWEENGKQHLVSEHKDLNDVDAWENWNNSDCRLSTICSAVWDNLPIESVFSISVQFTSLESRMHY